MTYRCPECGFEYHEDLGPTAGPEIVEGSDWIADAIESVAVRAAVRLDPQTWSPLEYAAHVRDILLVQRERVILARWTDTPSLAPMARDRRVEFDGYAEQTPSDVARQLRDAARMFDNVLRRMDDTAWDRTLIYNFPDPVERTLRWVAVHTLHEVRHHGRDVSLQVDSP